MVDGSAALGFVGSWKLEAQNGVVLVEEFSHDGAKIAPTQSSLRDFGTLFAVFFIFLVIHDSS